MISSLSQPDRAAVASLAEPSQLEAWEALWAPYDEATYAAVLAVIEPSDVVLDIGAGDLRLTRRIAEQAQQVIAWESNPICSLPQPGHFRLTLSPLRSMPGPSQCPPA